MFCFIRLRQWKKRCYLCLFRPPLIPFFFTPPSCAPLFFVIRLPFHALLFYFLFFQLPSPPPRFLFLNLFEVKLQIYLSMFLCYNMVWPLADFSKPDFSVKQNSSSLAVEKQFLSTLMFSGPPGFSLETFCCIGWNRCCLYVRVCLIGSCFCVLGRVCLWAVR